MGANIVHALDEISLFIERGEFVSIVVPSGAGKSSLLHVLGALQLPSAGTILVDGQSIQRLSDRERARYRNEKIGFVFQNFHLQKHLTALENVVLPLKIRGTKKSDRVPAAMNVMQEVGLSSRLHHLPGELSGGEQQRVAIARAIVGKPSIILADEPTGNLDSHTSNEIMHILGSLNLRYGITLIMVTHNMEMAQMTRRVIHLKDGKIERDERISHASE